MTSVFSRMFLLQFFELSLVCNTPHTKLYKISDVQEIYIAFI